MRLSTSLKASWTKGPMKATIRRQNVDEVIRPKDLVFLGHKIPNCGMSANLRQKIVKRAIKCAEKPSIIFDYDHRQVTNTHTYFHSAFSKALFEDIF